MITREQAFKIIGVLKTEYPEAYRNLKESELEQKAALYRIMYQEYSYEQVQAALYAYMSEGQKYEPKTGELIQRIEQLREKEREQEAQEAWTAVRKLISRASTVTQDEFNSLPYAAQRAIGGVFMLKCWGLETSAETVNTVIASQFISAYKAIAVAERARKSVPVGVLKVLQRPAEPEKLESKAADSAAQPRISDSRAAGEPARAENPEKPEEARTNYTDTEAYQRRRAALYERLKE